MKVKASIWYELNSMKIKLKSQRIEIKYKNFTTNYYYAIRYSIFILTHSITIRNKCFSKKTKATFSLLFQFQFCIFNFADILTSNDVKSLNDDEIVSDDELIKWNCFRNRCDKKSMNFSSSFERRNDKIARFLALFVKFERCVAFAS